DLWWQEAERYQVLPLTNQSGRGGDNRYRRDRYEFRPGIGALPPAVAPNLRNRGWRMWAELVVPDGGIEGVVAAHGGEAGGWTVFLKDGRLHYTYNYLGAELTPVSPAYKGRFDVTSGALVRVVMEADGRAYRNPEGEDRAAMAIQ